MLAELRCSHRYGRTLLLVWLVDSLVPATGGCSSSDNNAAAPDDAASVADGGLPETAPQGTDGQSQVSTTDGSIADASNDGVTGADSQVGTSDAGSLSCEAPIRLDTTGNISAIENIVAASVGTKFVVAWQQDGFVSTGKVLGTIVDGTAVGPEVDLSGAAVLAPHLAIAVDSTGRGFLQWRGARRVVDFAASMFAPATTFASDTNSGLGLAAIPSGGALSLYSKNGVAPQTSVEQWKPAGMSWQDTGLVGPSPIDSGTVKTNAAGHAVAAWSTGQLVVSAVAFDGSTWGPSISPHDFGGDAGSPATYDYDVYPNGDALFVVSYPDRIDAVKYSAGQWGAPTAIPSAGPSDILRIVIDAMGRATVAWVGAQMGPNAATHVSRNLGSGWTMPQSLGAAAVGGTHRLVLDPDSRPVVVNVDRSSSANPMMIWRAAPDGTTWSSTTTPLVSNNDILEKDAPVTFAGGYTILMAPQSATDGGRGQQLFATRCR
jgi:hypothetical protein